MKKNNLINLPDEGLDHPQEASEEQDVPSHLALSELTRHHQLLTVIFYGGWHTVKSLLFLGLYLCICVSLRGLMCFIRPLMRQLYK